MRAYGGGGTGTISKKSARCFVERWVRSLCLRASDLLRNSGNFDSLKRWIPAIQSMARVALLCTTTILASALNHKHHMQANKRQCLASKCWTEASKHIRNEGGYISTSLEFSGACRQVKLTQQIQQGELLMRIPPTTLMTLETVEKSPIGPDLFKIAHEVDDVKLFHEKNDVLLALFLAFVSLNNDDDDADSNSEYNGVCVYLATLPENDSYDNLPRRWSDDKLDQLLGGTSVLNRAREEKLGLLNDYNLLQESHSRLVGSEKEHEKDSLINNFPSLEIFDQMLAAVASRAFQSVGQDGIDAMIPLLDLLNHKRGVGETSDVTYKKEEDGSMHVRAKCDLSIGSTPSITYGAKGNNILLTRYGFALKDNVEPDGSSNDVMDFHVRDNTFCLLRTGSKSYTYGCFVKAIELFRDEEGNVGCDDQGKDNGPGGLEDFLNFEEEEEGFDMYGEVDDNDEDDQDETDDDGKESDCRAMESFRVALQDAEKKYSLSRATLEQALQSPPFSSERFCAYLVTSEMRTIHFYMLVADLIGSKLKGIVAMSKLSDETLGDKDSELLQKQAIQLRDTFCTIRYPDLP